MNSSIQIRQAKSQDYATIFGLLTTAFDSAAEAKLVEELQAADGIVVSLVAEAAGIIVGHIIFSEVTLSGNPGLKITGLAPVAVLPDFQRRGIGQALIEAGIEACTEKGYDATVVLGHPDYYPRFGFRPSTEFGFKSVYEVPDEAFMALELSPDALSNAHGVINYHAAFNTL